MIEHTCYERLGHVLRDASVRNPLKTSGSISCRHGELVLHPLSTIKQRCVDSGEITVRATRSYTRRCGDRAALQAVAERWFRSHSEVHRQCSCTRSLSRMVASSLAHLRYYGLTSLSCCVTRPRRQNFELTCTVAGRLRYGALKSLATPCWQLCLLHASCSCPGSFVEDNSRGPQ